MGAAWDRLSPRQKSWMMAGTVALISLAAGYGLSQLGEGQGGASDAGGSATECEEVLYWYDPMVPGQHFDEPGKSPFMDMQLVPKCAGEEATAGVRIDPGLVQNFGIRTTEAEYGVLEPEITVTGVLAVLNSGDEELAQAMRERMRLLGMPPGLISSVGRNGRPQSTITVTAPIGGAITSLGVRPGMTVMAGQTLAEITGFSPIWLEAAVPERQAATVRVGQPVSATLTAFPEERFSGPIIAILPSAQDASRTITVRAQLPNASGRLKPGMFAQVSLTPDTRRALLVPSEAVIRTGRRTIVMVKQDEGGFMPAEVRIGREAGGRTEVLAGLSAGEQVVTSGQFLLDSEASLTGLDVRPVDQADDASTGGEDEPATFGATGTIQSIANGSVTLRHGPVPRLDWPAMTMTFRTKSAAQMRGLETGDRVRFTFTQQDAGPRIESITRAGQ
jgi:Cu(I)/Ag(I) efflux system membrane fusion protein